MSFNYLVGSSVSKIIDSVLSSKLIPLNRYFPRGINWLYDIQRFSGSRDLPVIFDVGANVGQSAHDFLKFFPRSSVYCFEPVTETFAALDKRFGKSANCFKLAMGATRGTADISINTTSELNTLVIDPNNPPSKTETISIDTIDSFCRENKIQSIDVLKVDAQGWELKVIEGAASMLSTNSVRFVFTEVGFREDETETHQTFGTFNSKMESLGFRFCGLYEQYRYGDAKQFVYFGNALYLNPNFEATDRASN